MRAFKKCDSREFLDVLELTRPAGESLQLTEPCKVSFESFEPIIDYATNGEMTIGFGGSLRELEHWASVIEKVLFRDENIIFDEDDKPVIEGFPSNKECLEKFAGEITEFFGLGYAEDFAFEDKFDARISEMREKLCGYISNRDNSVDKIYVSPEMKDKFINYWNDFEKYSNSNDDIKRLFVQYVNDLESRDDMDSLNLLEHVYYDGALSKPVNNAKLEKIYESQIELGATDPTPYYNLSTITDNPERKMLYLSTATEMASNDAAYELIKLYFEGIGSVPPNIVAARSLAERKYLESLPLIANGGMGSRFAYFSYAMGLVTAHEKHAFPNNDTMYYDLMASFAFKLRHLIFEEKYCDDFKALKAELDEMLEDHREYWYDSMKDVDHLDRVLHPSISTHRKIEIKLEQKGSVQYFNFRMIPFGDEKFTPKMLICNMDVKEPYCGFFPELRLKYEQKTKRPDDINWDDNCIIFDNIQETYGGITLYLYGTKVAELNGTFFWLPQPEDNATYQMASVEILGWDGHTFESDLFRVTSGNIKEGDTVTVTSRLMGDVKRKISRVFECKASDLAYPIDFYKTIDESMIIKDGEQ